MKPSVVLWFPIGLRRESFSRLAMVLLMVVAFGLTACGDEEDGEIVISFNVDRESLSADGSDSARVNVTVSVGGAPAADGGLVALFAFHEDDSSADVHEAEGSPAVGRISGGLGRASFDVSCAQASSIGFAARYEDTRVEWNGSISCRDFSSGFVINVTASPALIGTTGQTRILAQAATADGEPLGEGIGLRFEVVQGQAEFVPAGLTRVVPTNAAGQSSVQLQGSGEETRARVCVEFTQERFEAPETCVNVVVTDEQPEGALCTVSFGQLRMPANGQAVTPVDILLVDEFAAAISDATVTISVNAGTFVTGPGGNATAIGPEAEVQTDAEGAGQTFLRAGADAGPAGTIATATWGDGESVECEIEEDVFFFGRPLCTFEGMDPNILGVAQSGRNESGTLRYCFADADGTPVQAGQRVHFDFVSNIGARLNASSAQTNNSGCVTVEVFSGFQAGQFDVSARFPFGDTATTCNSGGLSVLGARPSASGWTLSCNPMNVGAMVSMPVGLNAAEIIDQDINVNCSTRLRDRFGNPVTFPGTQVFFHSEQGTIRSPATPDGNGRVTTTYNPNGLKPRDVSPMPGEPRLVMNDGTNRIVNPRDMLVTIVAWTQGEEAFIDANGNGQYDAGELFFDLGEPLFDYNDNDQYNPQPPLSEGFIDVSTPTRPSNGVYDGPNGMWDGETTIWTQTRVLLTGRPLFGPVSQEDFRFESGISFPTFYSGFVNAQTGQPLDGGGLGGINIAAGQIRELVFVMRDQWLNPPNETSSVSYSLADCGSAISITPGPTPTGSAGVKFQRQQVAINQEGEEASAGEDIASYQFRTLLTDLDQAWAQPVRVTRGQGLDPLGGSCRMNVSVTIGGGGGGNHTQTLSVPIRESGF